ncbi:MAG: universal stress protein [Desulfobacteraceae bacterium]|jgi:nucleotide-binding universal stress UspA family protein
MLPKIKKILYATDLSDNSRLAFGYAIAQADQLDAQLMVVHVIEPVSVYTQSHMSSLMGESEWINIQQDYDERLCDDLMTQLRRFCDQMATDIPAKRLQEDYIFLRKGLPVEEILALADEQQADMIVLGTHGYGMLKDTLMGGTVRRVLRRSKTPVLVVRNPESVEA